MRDLDRDVYSGFSSRVQLSGKQEMKALAFNLFTVNFFVRAYTALVWILLILFTSYVNIVYNFR